MSSKLSAKSKKCGPLDVIPYIRPHIKQTQVFRVHKKRTIEDLSDDCLKLVFSQMTLKQKFAVERVSKRWKALVDEELANQTGFIVGSNPVELHRWVQPNRCSHENGIHYSKDEIDETDKLWLKAIAIKCPNIKCIAFRIDMNDQNIEWIQTNFPTLECIHITEKELQIKDGLKVANILSKTLRHLSINCKEISDETLLKLTSNLPLLEELQIIKFRESLKNIFQYLRKGIKSISLEECIGLTEMAINKLRFTSQSGITGLQIRSWSYGLPSRLLSLICHSFPNLKSFEFGFFRTREVELRPLAILSQLEHLKLCFFFGDPFNWAQNITEMSKCLVFETLKNLK
jgi:hypothetical protein